MLVPGLGAATDVARDKRHRAADRRAGEDWPSPREPEAAPAVDAEPYDAAYYASRFKSEVWTLGASAEPQKPLPAPDHESDARLFDFFGHLSVLLVAVRAGDIERARAAADALEMEVLVERSAGRDLSGPAALPWVADLGRMLRPAAAAAAEAPIGGAAYDTLAHYLADDAAPI